MTPRTLFTLLSATFLIQACNPFMVFRPDSQQLVEKGWAKEASNKKAPDPLYCYNTLGRVVCHTAPLKDQDRLNSFYGPKP